ncbi:hypothetical protein Peur_057030 [Populus x canadensis]
MNLASRFESLKRENQSLLIQVPFFLLLLDYKQFFKCKGKPVIAHPVAETEKPTCKATWGNRHQSESSHDRRFEDKGTDSESKRKPSFQLEGNDCKEDKTSSDNNSRNIECTREKIDILNQTEDAVDSMTSSNWQSFQSNCFLDESRCSSHWWELLS